MNNREHSESEWMQRCRDLEGVCALWMAANDAKDDQIRELEQEVRRLRRRVARLSRAQVHQPDRQIKIA